MKALSFLGVSAYQTVTYYWKDGEGERRCQTHLFPEALARIFEPEKLLVLVTPTARNYKLPNRERAYLDTLVERLGDLVEPVDIPEGKSEGELWEIFARCAEVVGEGEEILLDVTHAFRSLPLIVFAVAAYLRRTKGVTIRHIVYGAYEAREPFRIPPEPEDRTPIFDLTPLLDLLDWLSGAEAFMRRNDAALLAERLEQTHRRFRKEGPREELPEKLQKIGGKLRSLSRSLHLSRPREVMLHSNDLIPMLEDVTLEAQRWAKPFAVILDQIRGEVKALAHDEPDHLDEENLHRQLALIEHYERKGLILQAVTLAREWMVSWVILQRGEKDRWLDRNYRESEVEKALGAAAAQIRGRKEEVSPWFKGLPKSREAAKFWNQITDLRNNLAHCGMKSNAPQVNRIERQVQKIVEHLRVFLDER